MSGVAVMLFSDLVDSTALLAQLGDDRMDRVRRAHVEDVRQAVASEGGRVVKTLGDGAMASFESALGALGAAASIQAAVERLDATHGGIGIAARVGVAAGEPITDGEDLHGMAVVIASRLSSAAGTGEVLVQDLVGGLVASRDGVELEPAADYELKGVPHPVRASKLRWRKLDAGSGEEPDQLPSASPAPIRLPPPLASYAAQPLIGRDREIDSLREASTARPGRQAVLVLGEPGIGKTRHAAAAAAAAHEAGAVVVLARCPPEAVIAFEPWVRAIGELAQAGDDAWQAELAGAAGAELAALVPELSRHAGGSETAGAGEAILAEGARYRLLHGISAALGFAAGQAPLHVVLDDAHWCDPASAQALGHLLDSPPSQLVLVVTARDREMGRGHPVSRALGDLRRTRELTELRLGGLDASGLAALVGAQVGRAITPGLAERLQARTAGNPFFAAELVRDLDESGALRDSEALEAAPVPDAVADLVEERLARLDPATERLLGAVAAIGPSAPVALAAKAAGLGSEQADRAVAEALAERLVDDVVAAEPTIAFPHALVREALVAGSGEAAHARLHLAIAEALEEDPGAEPAELARHRGLAVELTGPEPAIAAYRAAATAAAASHDHEQAAAQVQCALALLPAGQTAARGSTSLELGEQLLLSADLVRARRAFGEAIESARTTGDAVTLARAALGFSGGDIGFGWEVGTDDPITVEQLREGLDALGDGEPRLALQMTFRLAYLSVFSDDDAELEALARRAVELEGRLEDAEARILARFTVAAIRFARNDDPPRSLDMLEGSLGLLELTGDCEREDLVFRVVMWSATACYILGRIEDCEAAIERAAEIAERLGSPRFSWEVDMYRGSRLMDRGDRAGGEALIRQAGNVVRRLRPDIQVSVELTGLMLAGFIYGADPETTRIAFEATDAAVPGRGFFAASACFAAAADGDPELARERLWSLLDDPEALRRPDGHVPIALCLLAYTATMIGDREAGEQLRPMLEPLRPYLVQGAPGVAFGLLTEWHIGRLELLAGRVEKAAAELHGAMARTDAAGVVWLSAWLRVDLALALHRCGKAEEARAALASGEEMAARYGVRWVSRCAGEVRAEMEGHEPPASAAPRGRKKHARALATRGGRRALVAIAADLDDEALERRFADPGRQRSLMKALARSFQPAHAAGFSGTIAYELEPYAIELPPEAPWRWAIEVDSKAGRARLLEPAPLDAAVTIHIGLADWVRTLAGIQDALTAMIAGRCSVEGDVVLAVRLEAMFGAR
jgi:class 3 adenylate cyclase